MDFILSNFASRNGFQTDFNQKTIIGNIGGYTFSIAGENNSYFVETNITNYNNNMIGYLNNDLNSYRMNMPYLQNINFSAWKLNFLITDGSYIDYNIYGSQSNITVEVIEQILYTVSDIFRRNQFMDACSDCGKASLTKYYEVSEQASSKLCGLCDECALNAAKGNVVSAKRRLLAALTAAVGGLIGAIIYAIIYYNEYIFYISGVIIAGLCFAGYKLIVKNRQPIDGIISGVISIVMCFLAEAAGIVSLVYCNPRTNISLADSISICMQTMEDSTVFFEVLRDTFILVIPAIITAIIYIVSECNSNNKRKSIRRI